MRTVGGRTSSSSSVKSITDDILRDLQKQSEILSGGENTKNIPRWSTTGSKIEQGIPTEMGPRLRKLVVERT